MSDPISTEHAAGYDAGAAVVTPVIKPASRWEDFVDIFYAPSTVFARREHSGFGVPMLVVTLVGAAIFYATFNAMAPIMDAEFSRGAAAAIKKGAKPEMLESMRSVSEKVARVMVFIIPPVAMFLTGLVLWIVGKFVGARQTLTAAIMVAAFANVPRLIGALLSGVQALLMDPASLTGRHAIALNAARFLDPNTTSPVLVALAGRLDVFTIWATVLLAIGLAITGKIPRNRAAVAALLVWVLGALPELAGALRQ